MDNAKRRFFRVNHKANKELRSGDKPALTQMQILNIMQKWRVDLM
jgi:hypothetical protein